MMNIVGARLSADTKASNDTRAIYLPNQTEQVSQIAIDVSAIADLGTVDWVSNFSTFHFFRPG